VYKSKWDTFYDEPLSVADFIDVDEWYVVLIRSQFEKETARLLDKQGFRTYLPLVPKSKRAGRGRRLRHVTVNRPAFYNYLFLGFRHAGPAWWPLFKTGFIRSVIIVNNAPVAIPQKQMIKLAMRIRHGALEKETEADNGPLVSLKDTVRIDGGPFQGFDSTIVAVNGMVDEDAVNAAKVTCVPLREGHAGLLVEIFGRQQFVEMRVDQLRRLP
jgi:transcription antitermination factor NusG